MTLDRGMCPGEGGGGGHDVGGCPWGRGMGPGREVGDHWGLDTSIPLSGFHFPYM